MSFLVSLLLPFVVCLALVSITATSWWSKLSAPWAYVAFAFLGILGLHRCLQAISEFVKLFISGGYFLEYQKRPDFAELAARSFTVEALVISSVLAISGWFLLLWLKTIMVR